jgi:hypothetical protein
MRFIFPMFCLISHQAYASLSEGEVELDFLPLVQAEQLDTRQLFPAKPIYMYNEFFLRLGGYEIYDDIGICTEKHPDITVLYLDSCGPLSLNDIEALQNFRHLKYLKLVGTDIDDFMLKTLLAGMLPKQLISLDINGHRLTNAGLAALTDCGLFLHLRKLAIVGYSDLPESIMAVFLNRLAGSALMDTLTHIYISGARVDDKDLSSIGWSMMISKSVVYDDFYSLSLHKPEIYLLDNPRYDYLRWSYDQEQCYLVSDPKHMRHQGFYEELVSKLTRLILKQIEADVLYM